MSIWFKGVNEPNGWMGNMAPYPITYNGQVWRTSEALFQSMRFNDPLIKAVIQAEESPMAAKMIAKKTIYRIHRVIEPMSPQDIANMEACVLLKFQQHPKIARLLMATGNHTIYEDASGRNKPNDLFWGAHRDPKNPILPINGTNMMGEILMKVRAILLANLAQSIPQAII
jgi:ribA/ribD-fused uncharacterized protein